MAKSPQAATIVGAVFALGAVGFGIMSALTGMAALAESRRSLAVTHTALAKLPELAPLSYVVVDGARLEPSLQLTKDYGACRNQPGRCWTQYVAIVPAGWSSGQTVPAWLKCFRGCTAQTWSAAALAGTLPLAQSLGERVEWPRADEALVREAERATSARSEPRACLLEPSEPPARSVRLYVFLALFVALCIALAVTSVVCFAKARSSGKT